MSVCGVCSQRDCSSSHASRPLLFGRAENQTYENLERYGAPEQTALYTRDYSQNRDLGTVTSETMVVLAQLVKCFLRFSSYASIKEPPVFLVS